MNLGDIRNRFSEDILQSIFAVIIAIAGVSFASQAAAPAPPPKPLTPDSAYWQSSQTTDTISSTTESHNAVITGTITATATTQSSLNTSRPPTVNATAFLVGNLNSGEIIAGRNITKQVPIASLTKLMTAVITRETIGANERIRISQSAANRHGNSGNLHAGQVFTAGSIYFPLLLSSSNAAAHAVAEHISTRKFLSLMNRKALALGMNQTQFADASGLSADNVSTASDQFRLVQYIHQAHRPLWEVTQLGAKTVHTAKAESTFANNHPLHDHPRFQGGKNGYTEPAQHTLISSFDINNQSVVIIVLGSSSHVRDTRKLLRWLRRK